MYDATSDIHQKCNDATMHNKSGRLKGESHSKENVLIYTFRPHHKRSEREEKERGKGVQDQQAKAARDKGGDEDLFALSQRNVHERGTAQSQRTSDNAEYNRENMNLN